MIKNNVQAIILAAGQSSRFNTGKSKLVEPLCGQPMILYPVNTLAQLEIPTTIVVGYQSTVVKNAITKEYSLKEHGENVTFVMQEKQLGTGHALMCTRAAWQQDHILIMNGDMPLVTPEIIEKLYTRHTEKNAQVSFITAHNFDPALGGYGRVIQSDGHVKIVEEKDFKGDPQEHCCINAGIYIVKRSFLEQFIDNLNTDNNSHEFYITDLIKIASDKGLTVEIVAVPFDRIRGINTLQELWTAEQIKRADLIKLWMSRGVRFTFPQNVHIDLNIEIGAGTVIGCGAHLAQGTYIGKNCTIGEFVSLENTHIGANSIILPHCIIKDSTIGDNVEVGPFAHVRNQSVLEDNCAIGNFVEIKNSVIGKGTKAKHLSYLGDAQVGDNVNIGAGTITCNFDGVSKHKTIIEDNVSVGSNNSLIAPVTLEKDCITAAGSTITDNVPTQALAIARARQINKEGYARVIKQRIQTTNKEDEVPQQETPFIPAVKTKNITT